MDDGDRDDATLPFRTHEELTAALDRLAGEAPELVDVTAIGRSGEGRSLHRVRVAGPDGPPVDRRPALLVTAGLHARELAGSWVALRLVEALIERYTDDDRVADVLDRGCVHVVPRVAVDGAERALRRRGRDVRSRYVDPGEHGVSDSDVVHPGDLTGDGRVLTMRWPDPAGDRTVLADDDRVLVPRRSTPGEPRPAYRAVREGPVPDYAGGAVSNPPTRNDFNRNFPSEAWEPFDWVGHGNYPLSEPETRAVAEFCYDRPNVVAVLDLHTGNPAIFYPSAVAGDADRAGDADLIERMGSRGEELTGFPYLSGYGEARGEGVHGTALPGSFKDFCYERLGVPAFVVELGMLYNYLGLETADLAMDDAEHAREAGRRLIAYHDDHPEAGLFTPWEPVDHPQLGTVEVGGWDWVRYSNPPPSELPAVAEGVIEFALSVAEWRPDVRVRPRAEPLCEDRHRVVAELHNRGALATGITERGTETHPRSAPRLRLEGGDPVGRRERRVDHLDAKTGEATVEWVVRASGESLSVTVDAPRGVYAEATVELDDEE